jgi:DNA-binding NtrC family response regulator
MNTPEEQQYFFNMFDEMYKNTVNTPLPQKVENLEIESIETALNKFDGNQTKAADMLGIGRTCLIAKMKKYGLTT